MSASPRRPIARTRFNVSRPSGRCACSSPPPTASPTSSAGPSSSTRTSARACPGREHHFLINPYGLRFDEVTASSLVKIDVDGNPVGPQQYKRQQGRLHHPQRDPHGARGRAVRLAHAHARRHGGLGAGRGLLPAHMYSHNFWQRLSYHDFEGPSMRARRAHAPGGEPRAEEPGAHPAQPRPAHHREEPSPRPSSASGA